MKKLLVLFLSAIIICVIFVCFFEEEILITSQNSPNGDYTIFLYQVGSPQWSFGSVKAKLVLKDSNGKTVDKQEFSLANDGAGVFEDNIKKITWMENQVEIVMGEADTTRKFTYVLSYTK